MKYEEWVKNWLQYQIRPTTKERTFERYRSLMSKHVLPKLGDYDIENLSAFTLQRFTVELTEKGLSANTVNLIISVIKNSLRSAVSFGIAEKQNADRIIRPRVTEKKVMCFSKEEQRKIERYVLSGKKQKYFGILLCLYSGLRIGELLALTWGDVDIAKGMLSVTKSCHDSWDGGAYKKVIETPKTESSFRTIPLPQQIMPYLKNLKKTAKSEYVIGKKARGEQVRTYQKMFENMLKRLQIEKKGFHSLRHTFATRALECGMDVKSLSEILGHKNPNVTLRRYAHSLLEHKRQMMNRLGKLLL